MIPAASQIMARRWWARLCVRAAALVALMIGLAGGIGSSSGFGELLHQMGNLGVGGSGSVITGIVVGMAFQILAPLGLGLALVWFERRIVRWLVPIPTHRCPRCDYSLIGVHEPHCPECGLPLDEAVVGDIGAEEGPRTLAGSLPPQSSLTPPAPPPPPPRRRETVRPDPE